MKLFKLISILAIIAGCATSQSNPPDQSEINSRKSETIKSDTIIDKNKPKIEQKKYRKNQIENDSINNGDNSFQVKKSNDHKIQAQIKIELNQVIGTGKTKTDARNNAYTNAIGQMLTNYGLLPKSPVFKMMKKKELSELKEFIIGRPRGFISCHDDSQVCEANLNFYVDAGLIDAEIQDIISEITQENLGSFKIETHFLLSSSDNTIINMAMKKINSENINETHLLNKDNQGKALIKDQVNTILNEKVNIFNQAIEKLMSKYNINLYSNEESFYSKSLSLQKISEKIYSNQWKPTNEFLKIARDDEIAFIISGVVNITNQQKMNNVYYLDSTVTGSIINTSNGRKFPLYSHKVRESDINLKPALDRLIDTTATRVFYNDILSHLLLLNEMVEYHIEFLNISDIDELNQFQDYIKQLGTLSRLKTGLYVLKNVRNIKNIEDLHILVNKNIDLNKYFINTQNRQGSYYMTIEKPFFIDFCDIDDFGLVQKLKNFLKKFGDIKLIKNKKRRFTNVHGRNQERFENTEELAEHIYQQLKKTGYNINIIDEQNIKICPL